MHACMNGVCCDYMRARLQGLVLARAVHVHRFRHGILPCSAEKTIQLLRAEFYPSSPVPFCLLPASTLAPSHASVRKLVECCTRMSATLV